MTTTQTPQDANEATIGAVASTAMLGAWIPVSTALPAKDEWVQVFEDDNDNPQDAYIMHMCKSFRQRVTPAKLLSVDSEGYANWYLCYVGGGPVKHVRNVTHWRPLADAPNDQIQGAEPLAAKAPSGMPG